MTATLVEELSELRGDGESVRSHFLQENCQEVDIEISWFSRNRKIGKTDAVSMAATVDANQEALSISKRLFSSKHPAVKALNAARSRISQYVTSMTIPMAALPPDLAGNPEDFAMKAPGSRLIMVRDIAEFDERIVTLTDEMMAAAREVDRVLPQIIAEERTRLGRLFREDEYPDSVAASICVRGPGYRAVGFSVDFSKLAPKAYARAVKRMKAQLDQTVAIASAEFCGELAEAAAKISAQLSNRMRLRLPKTHEDYAKYNDAEVIRVETHETDSNLDDGQVLIEIRPVVKKVKGDTSKAKSVTIELGPMTEAEYEALGPYETGERCKVYDSTILQLRERLEAFRRIGSMLGDNADAVSEHVTAIEQLLADRRGRPKTAEQLATEMRKSDGFRGQVSKALDNIARQISRSSVATASPVRGRMISRKSQDG